MHTDPCRRLLIVTLVLPGVALSLIAALPALADDGDTPTAMPPAKTASQILADIETFQFLHRMKLSAEQAAALLKVAKPLQDMFARRAAEERAPEVIKVLLDFRAAALAGKPITPEMWAQLVRAQMAAAGEELRPQAGDAPEPEEADDENPIWKAATGIAEGFVEGLADAQLAGLVHDDVSEFAADLVHEAIGNANADDQNWAQWLDDVVEEILAGPDDLTAGSDAKLRAYFNKLHGLKPEKAAEQTDRLTAELAALMTPTISKGDLQEQAAERLADELMFNRHLLPCLAEYVGAGVGG